MPYLDLNTSEVVSLSTMEAWKEYHQIGIISSDFMLLEMMQEVVDTKNLLERIDKVYYRLVVDRLLMEWHSLVGIARARNIKGYPSIVDLTK